MSAIIGIADEQKQIKAIASKDLDVLQRFNKLINEKTKDKTDTDIVTIDTSQISVSDLKKLAQKILAQIKILEKEEKIKSDQAESLKLQDKIATNLGQADKLDTVDTFISYFKKGNITAYEDVKDPKTNAVTKKEIPIKFDLENLSISPTDKTNACINGFAGYLKKSIGTELRQIGLLKSLCWKNDSKWKEITDKIKIETFNEKAFDEKFKELTGDDKTNFYEKFLDELFYKGTYFYVKIGRDISSSWPKFLEGQTKKEPSPKNTKGDLPLCIKGRGSSAFCPPYWSWSRWS